MVLDGLRSSPQHHTLPSMLADRAAEVRHGAKRVWIVHEMQSSNILFEKSSDHIFRRSKEALEEQVHPQ